VKLEVKPTGNGVRELAWTVAGASAGNLARHWVDPGRSPEATLVLAAVAATLIGFALVASLPAPMKTVLFAAGGTIGSISAVATRAATATPAQSVLGLGAFFVGAVLGLLLGTVVPFSVAKHGCAERF
jgi:hypothetical protein